MNRYPLSWPAGWKRTPPHIRVRAKFGRATRHGSDSGSYVPGRALTIAEAVDRLRAEIGRLGVLGEDFIISTNVKLRLDGFPRGDASEPADPGAAVYWQRPEDKTHKVIAIDIYDRVADNIAALAATIEAMRAIERHGGAVVLERAFTGFDALPAPGQTAVRGWREVFGFLDGSKVVSGEQLQNAYMRMRLEAHPDRGGSPERFHEVQTAYDQARQEFGG